MILLLSSNYREVEFAHNALITKGDFIPAATFGGTLNGFCAFADVAANLPGAYVVHADAVEATKVPGDNLAFAPGEKVYYNIVAAKVTKTTSDVLIGFAKRAALAADVVVILNFDGKAQEDRPDIDTITLSQISDLADLELADLADVDLTGAATGAILKLAAGGKWEDAANTLAALADVDVAGADDNDTIKYVLGTTKWTKVAV